MHQVGLDDHCNICMSFFASKLNLPINVKFILEVTDFSPILTSKALSKWVVFDKKRVWLKREYKESLFSTHVYYHA